MNIGKALGNYTMNVLIWLDQGLNTISGGDPDETVSSRLGRIKKEHGGTIPWTRPVSRLLDKFLDTVDKNHCEDAIEEDEGGKGIIDKPE